VLSLLYNRVGVGTATTGTGNVTYGSRITDATNGDWLTPSEAGLSGTVLVDYLIVDGNNVEFGRNSSTTTTLTRTAGGVVASIISGSHGTTRLTLSGTAKVYFTALADSHDGTIERALSADTAGANNNSLQLPWNALTDASVRASTTYDIEMWIGWTKSAGTTGHTVDIGFAGGTCTFTDFKGELVGHAAAGSAWNQANSLRYTSATAQAMTTSLTSAAENGTARFKGRAIINAAGTFEPQFRYSAAPGGAPTWLRGSFFRLRPLGDGDVTVRN
jgi:hypothetical protein